MKYEIDDLLQSLQRRNDSERQSCWEQAVYDLSCACVRLGVKDSTFFMCTEVMHRAEGKLPLEFDVFLYICACANDEAGVSYRVQQYVLHRQKMGYAELCTASSKLFRRLGFDVFNTRMVRDRVSQSFDRKRVHQALHVCEVACYDLHSVYWGMRWDSMRASICSAILCDEQPASASAFDVYFRKEAKPIAKRRIKSALSEHREGRGKAQQKICTGESLVFS